MIDRCGLKGLRAGGAEVSCDHANFIINTGGASYEDVMGLAGTVRRLVREKFGCTLQPEIKILDKDGSIIKLPDFVS
jgi:UDP-N-acetylmuramate dehydrogenase